MRQQPAAERQRWGHSPKRGILYAPDFIINAGGLINVTEELGEEGYSPTVARGKTHNLYDELMKIYEMATTTRSRRMLPHYL